MNPEKTKVYFSHLDALRFFAFLGVFYAHTGSIFFGTTLTNAFPVNILKQFTVYGSYGVNFFFVLSGFLITFLLLREKAASNNIAIKKFYMRRILRIWPVYFMTLFFAYFVLQHIIPSSTAALFPLTNPSISFGTFLYHFFFLGNIYQGLEIGAISLSIGILWSVCMEEQFYLIWPWVIKYLEPKRLLQIIFMIIGLTLLAKIIFLSDRAGSYYMPWSLGMDLAFGALLGTYYFLGKTKNAVKFTGAVIIASVLTTLAVSIFSKPHLLDILRLVKTLILDSVFVLILVLFISLDLHLKGKWISAGHRLLTYLGRISYGLYAYHTICLMLTVHILVRSGLLTNTVSLGDYCLVVICAFLGTIAVASLSYHFIERKILSLKSKF